MVGEQVGAEAVGGAVHAATQRAHRATLVHLPVVDERARILERLAAQLAAMVLAAGRS